MNAPVVLYDHRGGLLSSPEIRRNRIRAKYDAAQTTDENQRHWRNADYLGPNAQLDPCVRRMLRSRARYECANNTYASGMVRTLANDTIGTGPGLQITQKEISRDDANVIENLFWEWCLAIDLPHKLRMLRMAKARDGEVFAHFTSNPRLKSRVQLDLIPFEADYVSSAYPLASNANSFLDGLIVDDYGNVIAYNVLKEHPGEQEYLENYGESNLLPASEVIHLAHIERPGQYRGCPEITPGIPLYAQLRRFTLAVIRAAESAAIPSWIMKTQSVPNDGIDPYEAFDKVLTERGMGMALPGGWDISQLKAEHPTSTYPQFKREILAEIARCLCMPYNVAAGDSSSYNYSSGRLDHRTYFKSLRVERATYLESKTLDVTFRNWWDEASRLPKYLPESVYRAALPMHEWRWDGDEHVDPTKEIDAAVTRVAFGFSSIDDEVAVLGKDRSVVHHKNAQALGLTHDEYSKRLADKFFGAQVASSSQEQPEPPPANPQNTGGQPNA